MKNTNTNTARRAAVENLARAICEPSADCVAYGTMTPAEYVAALFTSHAAEKLADVDAPAAVAVAICETPADENADAVYMSETVPARDTLDAIALGHIARAAVMDAHDETPPARRAVTVDFVRDPSALVDAARMIARTTCKNAVMREGTANQWNMYRAARARLWDVTAADNLSDEMYTAAENLADMVQTAAAMIVDALALDSSTAARRAAVLRDAAAKLRDVPAGYGTARETVLNVARAALRNDDDGARAIVDDAATLAARARVASMLADYARERDNMDTARATFAARHIAYRAVNNYLTDARAIRTNNAPAPVSLDAIGDNIAALLAPADDITARAIIARRDALADALALMPPAMAETCRRLARGYSIRAIARTTNRHKKTIEEHRDAARRIIAARLADMDADARAAVRVSRYLADMDADNAAATIAAAMDNADARRARAARNTVPAALVDAARDADNAAAMLAAARDTARTLPPVAADVLALYVDGVQGRDAAARLGRHHSTVQEHARRIAAALVPALYAAIGIDMPPRVVVSLAALVTFLKSIA